MERFKELEGFDTEQLYKIRDEVRDELAELISQRYRLIAQIMFYEKQIEDAIMKQREA